MRKGSLLCAAIVLIATGLVLSNTADAAKSKKYITPEQIRAMNLKITPIKGLIIICKSETTLGNYRELATYSRIKVLTREHLDEIFKEQKLQLSGMTDQQKTIRAGQLLGASHILLYELIGTTFQFAKIINIETSEIEYDKMMPLDDVSINDFMRILVYYAAP